MVNIGKNKIIHKVIILLLIIFSYNSTQGQVNLFPDRSSCVSGDTIWFNTIACENNVNKPGNVVHVQLDNIAGNHITKVSVLCKNNVGQGYLPVPDSLSTGVYVLKAFSLGKTQNTTINQRLLVVYNRFDNKLNELNVPLLKDAKYFSSAPEIMIRTNKEVYNSREQVNTSIQLPEETRNNLKSLYIVAGMSDPVSGKFNSLYIPSEELKSNIPSSMEVEENNGILVCGKISNQAIKEEGDAIVLLSISDSVPYFDYCVSDKEGYFDFYLQKAFGLGRLALQAIVNNSVVTDSIVLLNNYIDTKPELEFNEQILTFDERKFATDLIDASYYEKIFTGYSSPSSLESFSLQLQYSYPFYGKPSITVFPELFIDLPDFDEISRELLRGVQYREKKNEITIRVVDRGTDDVFTKEPLRLLDGIPVFNNRIFAPLGTNNIKKVEAVYYQRFYGDLTFNGVLAVYTQNKPANWAETISGVKVFNYKFLQPEKNASAKVNFQNIKRNTPDLNQVLYRKTFNQILPENPVSFVTSDISGKITIRIMAVTKQNSILYSEKTIEVK